MILNLGSLAFNANIAGGGGTPAWGTELGQGEGYKFTFEDMSDFFTGMVYSSVADLDNVTCPLGKGGSARNDYDFVIASVFNKIYVNGIRVDDAQFLLLVIKKLVGDHHVGRRTIKYNPRMTYRGKEINADCYKKMEHAIGLTEDSAWFVHEIKICNQDELHFYAYELGDKPIDYTSNEERKNAFLSKLPKDGKRKYFEKLDLSHLSTHHQSLLTALRTKPFVLLAGISGTGKIRIVRELAKACWPQDNKERKEHKPRNYEMVQVRPNWHDSSELLGYVSRIGGEPQFVAGDLLKFVVRAWEEPSVPYFLCLDEMNLAPVEQYFAEFLSVIETRKLENGTIVTDPLLKRPFEKDYEEPQKYDEPKDWYWNLINELTTNENLKKQFRKDGIAIPQNLFVVGTVNMDETTFSFSRKVLDRAMTIEMNEVNLHGGLGEDATSSEFGYIDNTIIPRAVEGKDVYTGENKELCDEVLKYLEKVNEALDGTPFKIAYRTRNEFLVYAVIRGAENLTAALDEMTSMKILSRIEGDSERTKTPLEALEKIVNEHINTPEDGKQKAKSISATKITEMLKKLDSGYTSFWS